VLRHASFSKKVDRNTLTGISLMMLIFLGYSWFTSPTKAEIAEQERLQDSITNAAKKQAAPPIAAPLSPPANDTAATKAQASKMGIFSASGTGTAQDAVLENAQIKLTFSTKGGTIKSADVKGFQKQMPIAGKAGGFTKAPAVLLNSPQNTFNYQLPLTTGVVNTADLYFTPTVTGKTLTLRANAGDGKAFEQVYTLAEDGYTLDYKVRFVGLNTDIADSKIALNWRNKLNKMEKSPTYEATLTSINYKVKDETPTYISFGTTTEEEIKEGKLEWVAHTQQFFNTTLIAKNGFATGATLSSVAPEDKEKADYLLDLKSDLAIPYQKTADETFDMRMYVGVNDYDRLKAEKVNLEAIIPFGWSVFRFVNVWMMRPIFLFLSKYIGSAGLVILLLTFLVKLVLYPLSYKMLYSQAKMGVLKPILEKMRAKHGDDQQAIQAEQMKLYGEYGVSPLGGCMPMLVQMPVWLALYRFFPASLEFRQKSFLWADDLSSYDSVLNFGFHIPSYGDHISLFAILWAVTTLAYTYYNSKDMDFSANPAMKYMQYLTPVIFVVFFNSFASGLSCYLVFSNLLNIAQTLITKHLVIDSKKLAAEMEIAKNNPKPKTGFQAKIQEAMRAQQEIAKQQDAAKGKK
jgi:YidC/Oxa1 family membrane protein insertase